MRSDLGVVVVGRGGGGYLSKKKHRWHWKISTKDQTENCKLNTIIKVKCLQASSI